MEFIRFLYKFCYTNSLFEENTSDIYWVFVKALTCVLFTWPQRYSPDALHGQHHSLTVLLPPLLQDRPWDRQGNRRGEEEGKDWLWLAGEMSLIGQYMWQLLVVRFWWLVCVLLLCNCCWFEWSLINQNWSKWGFFFFLLSYKFTDIFFRLGEITFKSLMLILSWLPLCETLP